MFTIAQIPIEKDLPAGTNIKLPKGYPPIDAISEVRIRRPQVIRRVWLIIMTASVPILVNTTPQFILGLGISQLLLTIVSTGGIILIQIFGGKTKLITEAMAQKKGDRIFYLDKDLQTNDMVELVYIQIGARCKAQ